MFGAALHALALLLEPARLALLLIGVLIGLAIGAVPGLGGIVGLAVMIPFTQTLDAHAAFALLLGMAAVVTSSDLIPAILFGVPGTVGAAATVIDGHQMARRGEAGRAFGAGFFASLVGGLIGAVVLAAAIPILRPLLLSVGSPELLSFSIFGLSMVATLSGRAPLKGLTVAGVGLMLAMIGSGTQTGTMRWTFEWLYLWDGLPIIPVTIGLFALPELAELAVLRTQIAAGKNEKVSLLSQWAGVRDVIDNWWLTLRCGLLGTLLGSIPGIGSAVIDWIVYGYAKRTERDGDLFGTGDVRGVIAPESANNAKEGGHLVPTIAFGVPSGASMALLLTAFTMHGLVPGPDMLTKNLDVTYTIIWSLTLAHVIAAAICIFSSRGLAKLSETPPGMLLPIIIPMVFIAAFEATRSWGDLISLFVFGVVGWMMKRLHWPRPPMILGLVVGPIFERYLFISDQLYGSAWLLRPVVIAVGLLIAWVLFRPMRQTAVEIWQELRHLQLSQLRFGQSGAFTLAIIAIVVFALIASSDWPLQEQIVPRTACWAALIAACLNMTTEIFGRTGVVPLYGAELAGLDSMPPRQVRWRATSFLLWLVAFMVFIALIGFIPAIGVFVFCYMRFGFEQSLRRAVISAVILTLLCWAIFHWGLAVPWPHSILGDAFPGLHAAIPVI
ncbi:MAG: tripartite tricarboxylate transporter permease [Alphaproteobacteria bacterium]|nr:tripartite tricarboxylate transporter permease [Alphaproteobacteria bacterium]